VQTLRPDVAVEQIEVADPAGSVKKLSRGSRADFSYGDTDRIGVYGVNWNGVRQRSFAVNLLDAQESNIEPRTAVQLGAVRVQGTPEGRAQIPQTRELWKWFIVLAVGLLLVEWYIYNRRVYF
jgi:hypothetical protein